MADLIASSERDAIIGMGATGLSVARFLQKQGRSFVMLDTRTTPPNLDAFQREFPRVPVELGPLSASLLSQMSRCIVSPGISTAQAPFDQVREACVSVIGDIQLFAEAVSGPVVAITGSNGKSTVTELVGRMLVAAGHETGVGGNLGTPALDLLDRDTEADYYVLELSSFQLETTTNLGADVATVLNVSADHMDRYGSLQAYHAAKQRIYQGAKKVVVNRDDPLTQPLLHGGVEVISFCAGRPDLKDFGLVEEGDEVYLARGLEKLMPVSEMKLAGRHNWLNALAALAIGDALALPRATMLETLRDFAGLPHRCQWVGEIDGVSFYNDSKATNVGATVAALNGLRDSGAKQRRNIVLIAGGESKGADFSPLVGALADTTKTLVSIGRDAPFLEQVAEKAQVATRRATDMVDAVAIAAAEAEPGDAVLLAPACASFDMFDNYQQRGQAFIDAVNALQSSSAE